MSRRTRSSTAALLVLWLALPGAAFGWGLASHRMIEEEAIGTLPAPLRAWFAAHREEISDGSVEPDTVLREKNGREEAIRHFIDLDLYGRPPFAELPRDYGAAIARHGRKTVEDRGTVPWTIEEKHERMTGELRAGRWREALRTAAYAGHYVADATMPLHMISDYDGKASGLAGIHKATERDVIDERIGRYRKRVRGRAHAARATYGRAQIWELLSESYAAVPELMSAAREARRAGDVGSPAFAAALDRLTEPLLVRRLARAVEFTGAFWASAWVEAGRPTPP